jgi:hypothetical protein
LWAEGLIAEDIHKEMCPIYGGKFLSPRTVHTWVEKRDRRFSDKEVETEVRKWLRQQSKYFCAVGFDTLIKQWDKCISGGGGYVKK